MQQFAALFFIPFLWLPTSAHSVQFSLVQFTHSLWDLFSSVTCCCCCSAPLGTINSAAAAAAFSAHPTKWHVCYSVSFSFHLFLSHSVWSWVSWWMWCMQMCPPMMMMTVKERELTSDRQVSQHQQLPIRRRQKEEESISFHNRCSPSSSLLSIYLVPFPLVHINSLSLLPLCSVSGRVLLPFLVLALFCFFCFCVFLFHRHLASSKTLNYLFSALLACFQAVGWCFCSQCVQKSVHYIFSNGNFTVTVAVNCKRSFLFSLSFSAALKLIIIIILVLFCCCA